MLTGDVIAIALEYDAVYSWAGRSRQTRSAFGIAKAMWCQCLRDASERRQINLSRRLHTVTEWAAAGQGSRVFLPCRRDEEVGEIRGAVFVGHLRNDGLRPGSCREGGKGGYLGVLVCVTVVLMQRRRPRLRSHGRPALLDDYGTRYRSPSAV